MAPILGFPRPKIEWFVFDANKKNNDAAGFIPLTDEFQPGEFSIDEHEESRKVARSTLHFTNAQWKRPFTRMFRCLAKSVAGHSEGYVQFRVMLISKS